MQLKSTLTWDKQATGLLAWDVTRRHISECFVKAAIQVPILSARMSKPTLDILHVVLWVDLMRLNISALNQQIQLIGKSAPLQLFRLDSWIAHWDSLFRTIGVNRGCSWDLWNTMQSFIQFIVLQTLYCFGWNLSQDSKVKAISCPIYG